MGATLKKPESPGPDLKKAIAQKRKYPNQNQKLGLKNGILDIITFQPSCKMSKPILIDFSGTSINLGQVIIEPCSNPEYALGTGNSIRIYGRPNFKKALNGGNKKFLQRFIEAPDSKLSRTELEALRLNYEKDIRRSYYYRFDKLGKDLMHLTGSSATIGTSCNIDIVNSDSDDLSLEGKLLLKKIDEMEVCKDTVKISNVLLEFLHLLKLTILRPDFITYERRNSFEKLFRLLKELCDILIRVHNEQNRRKGQKNKFSILEGGDL